MGPRHNYSDLESKVGQRIKRVRLDCGMSQTELGRSLGVSFQQVQKYENGTNAVSLRNLLTLASLFHVDPCTFWSEAECEGEPGSSPTPRDGAILELMRSYSRITNPKVRAKLLQLMRAIAGREDREDF